MRTVTDDEPAVRHALADGARVATVEEAVASPGRTCTARSRPGTEADLVWWLGATKGAVRRALDDVGAVAVQLEDGEGAWLRPDDQDPVADPGPWAALLPALDPTTMGSSCARSTGRLWREPTT